MGRQLTRSVTELAHLHCKQDELQQRLIQAASAATRRQPDVTVQVNEGSLTYSSATGGGSVEIVATPSTCSADAPLFGEVEASAYSIHAVLRGPQLHEADRRTHELLAVLARPFLPLSRCEREIVSRLNPGLARIHSTAFTPETVLLIREHPLVEKLNLVDAFVRGGVSPDRILFASKPDSTAYRRRVLAELSERGCRVAGEHWRSDLLRFMRAHDQAREVVAIDDGGELIVEHHSMTPGVQRARYIETNARGMQRLHAAGLAEGVTNLSDSPAKTGVNQAIALSGVHAFKSAVQHRRQSGEGVNVVGFGRIGCHVARALRMNGFSVTVAEVSPSRREAALTDGFEAFATVGEALLSRPHRYIFGCSGDAAVGLTELNLLQPDAVIATLSSNDLSRCVPEAQVDRDWKVTVDGRGTRIASGRHDIWMLGHGNAVNLHALEGVPEPDFDEFLTHVVQTAAALVSCDDPVTTATQPEASSALR